jgi:hypothetical protein
MQLSAGIVTGRRTTTNREGEVSVRLLLVQVTDDQDVQTAQLIGQTGEESNPPDGSMVALVEAGSGFQLAVSTGDAIAPVMSVGGKRIYSTNAAGAEVMAEVKLDPDGTVTIEGPIASMTLDPDGTVTVTNGAASITMSPAGVITFHGTAANFDCPVTAPSISASVAGGGSGAITATSVAATGDVTADGVSLTGHVHSGVQAGGDNTGVPV